VKPVSTVEPVLKNARRKPSAKGPKME